MGPIVTCPVDNEPLVFALGPDTEFLCMICGQAWPWSKVRTVTSGSRYLRLRARELQRRYDAGDEPEHRPTRTRWWSKH